MPAKVTADEIAALLIAGRRTVALCVGAGIAAALLFAWIGPKWYEATLTVVPVTPARQMSGLAGALSGLGASLPMEITPPSEDAERIAAVFQSNSVLDGAIERLDLMARYHKRYIEQARITLAKRCISTIDKKPKIVKLVCEDRDPAFAQKLTLTFAELGNKVFSRVGAGAATEERRFLERRVAEARKEADEAALRLRAFQEEHGIIDLGEQSKVVVNALASLRKDELSKELELGYLNSFATSDEATAVQLRQQLALLRRKQQNLESRGSDTSGGGDVRLFPSALAIPKLSYQLVQLLRETKIREATHTMLVERYEAARVNEARDTPNFTILDAPRVPTYRSRPAGTTLLFLGVFAGTAVGILILLGPRLFAQSKKIVASMG